MGPSTNSINFAFKQRACVTRLNRKSTKHRKLKIRNMSLSNLNLLKFNPLKRRSGAQVRFHMLRVRSRSLQIAVILEADKLVDRDFDMQTKGKDVH